MSDEELKNLAERMERFERILEAVTTIISPAAWNYEKEASRLKLVKEIGK